MRAIVLQKLPSAQPAWRAPVAAFDPDPVDVWVEPAFRVEAFADGPQENGLVLGLLDGGVLVAVRPIGCMSVAPQPRTSTERRDVARLHHRLSCPVAIARGESGPGEPGECRDRMCGRRIYWIKTPSGKAAPVDPTPHRGVRLSKSEARAAVHTRGYVVGLTRSGEQAAIREGGQMTLGADLAETATVWVNHFATCPRRQSFVRPHVGRRG